MDCELDQDIGRPISSTCTPNKTSSHQDFLGNRLQCQQNKSPTLAHQDLSSLMHCLKVKVLCPIDRSDGWYGQLFHWCRRWMTRPLWATVSLHLSRGLRRNWYIYIYIQALCSSSSKSTRITSSQYDCHCSTDTHHCTICWPISQDPLSLSTIALSATLYTLSPGAVASFEAALNSAVIFVWLQTFLLLPSAILPST